MGPIKQGIDPSSMYYDAAPAVEVFTCEHVDLGHTSQQDCEEYENSLLEEQVKARRPAPVGTLAGLIRKAKQSGLITPAVSSYHN